MLTRSLRPPRRTHLRGLTLIELLTVLTLVGILLVLALPGVGTWTRDARVRTVSEEIANALRLAQAEAVARNRVVAFVRTSATPALNATPNTNGRRWYVQVLPLNSEETATYVQGGSFTINDGATVAGQTIVCFNSVGRVVSRTDPISGSTTDCTAPTSATAPATIDVSLTGSSFAAAATGMRVEVFLGGRTRLCNRNAASGQPHACT
jgi:type IV fimbrial biogenesis protein FimT